MADWIVAGCVKKVGGVLRVVAAWGNLHDGAFIICIETLNQRIVTYKLTSLLGV